MTSYDYFSYVIFRDCVVYVNSPYSKNCISSEVRVENEAFSVVFYDYIVEEAINDENRDKNSSIVMSDAQADEFIKPLIKKVETRNPSLNK